MNEREAQKLISVMTTALPREWSFLTKDQQKATEGIYRRMLADLPYAAANAAVEALLASATKMPTIAEVREATLRAMHGSVRPGGDAWGDVKKLGTYRNVAEVSAFDVLVLRVCHVMGWVRTRTLTRGGVDVEQICVSLGDNESADRKQFIDLYERYAREARHEQNTAQLPAAQRFRALQAAERRQITQARAGEPARVDFAQLIPGDTAQ